jgi:hypothetical protein
MSMSSGRMRSCQTRINPPTASQKILFASLQEYTISQAWETARYTSRISSVKKNLAFRFGFRGHVITSLAGFADSYRCPSARCAVSERLFVIRLLSSGGSWPLHSIMCSRRCVRRSHQLPPPFPQSRPLRHRLRHGLPRPRVPPRFAAF